MDDVRWFAPNRYCTLIVPRLRDRGLSIALEGDGPARLAIAMDAQVAAAAYSFAARGSVAGTRNDPATTAACGSWPTTPAKCGCPARTPRRACRSDWVLPAAGCPSASIQSGSHPLPRLEYADCSPCHISRRTRTMRRSFERLLASRRRPLCAL